MWNLRKYFKKFFQVSSKYFKIIIKNFIMFHRFLLFLVILITLADGLILLGVFGIEPFAEPVKNNLEIFISVFCLQLPLVYFAIYKAYIYPIEELKQ